MKKGIIELNDNIFSLEQLQSLITFIPTSEEVDIKYNFFK